MFACAAGTQDIPFERSDTLCDLEDPHRPSKRNEKTKTGQKDVFWDDIPAIYKEPPPMYPIPRAIAKANYPPKLIKTTGAPHPTIDLVDMSSEWVDSLTSTRIPPTIPTVNESSLLVYHCESNIKPTKGYLSFESRFESGNLHSAYAVSPTEYILYIRPDTSTVGHTQWYYFRTILGDQEVDTKIQFHIVNIVKPNSLYGRGMRPVVYTDHWFHGCEDVHYTCNLPRKPMTRSPQKEKKPSRQRRHSFTLSFTFTFETRKPVYFAHTFPYTYTQLQDFLSGLDATHCRHKVLGQTPLGNNIDLVTITNRVNRPEDLEHRQVVLILGRIHPGEPNSSYIAEDIVKFLNSSAAAEIRSEYVFKIVPCVNPDGVILGNYRTNFTGYDLNRHWNVSAKPELEELCILKDLVRRTKPVLCIDLHAHTFGVFLYGCERFMVPLSNSGKTDSQTTIDDGTKDLESVICLADGVMEKVDQSEVHGESEKQEAVKSKNVHRFVSFCEQLPFFDRFSCHFKTQNSKLGTARVVLNQMGILSYTMEVSVCGTSKEHFGLSHFRDIGESLVKTIVSFLSSEEAPQFDGIDDGQAVLGQEDGDDSDSDDDEYRIEVKASKTSRKVLPKYLKPPKAKCRGTKHSNAIKIVEETAPADLPESRGSSRPSSARSSRSSGSTLSMSTTSTMLLRPGRPIRSGLSSRASTAAPSSGYTTRSSTPLPSNDGLISVIYFNKIANVHPRLPISKTVAHKPVIPYKTGKPIMSLNTTKISRPITVIPIVSLVTHSRNKELDEEAIINQNNRKFSLVIAPYCMICNPSGDPTKPRSCH